MRASGYVHTHTGRRERNEDHACVEPDIGLFAVADGMGGYAGGQLASQLVIDTISDFFHRAANETDPGFDSAGGARSAVESRMDLAVRQAHRAVCRKAVGPLKDMGSTLAALIVHSSRALIAHVGDSRVYRLRGGELHQLTRDHSLAADLAAAGGTAGSAMRAAVTHVVTRAISPRCRPVVADMRVEVVHPGDRFFLCTDGLSDVLPDELVEGILSERPANEAAKRAVELAYDAGSLDNITGLVVDVTSA